MSIHICTELGYVGMSGTDFQNNRLVQMSFVTGTGYRYAFGLNFAPKPQSLLKKVPKSTCTPPKAGQRSWSTSTPRVHQLRMFSCSGGHSPELEQGATSFHFESLPALGRCCSWGQDPLGNSLRPILASARRQPHTERTIRSPWLAHCEHKEILSLQHCQTICNA